jgi:hypothetical protein
MAGASVNELVKEREGAPLSLPHSFGPFLNLFPSFFEATLTGHGRSPHPDAVGVL